MLARPRLGAALAITLLLLCPRLATLRAQDAADPLAPVREALLDGDWEAAERAARAAAERDDAPRDEALLLLATALRAQGRFDAAAPVLDRLAGLQPPSPLRRKALFLKADGLARARDFDAAIAIYARSVDELADADRRDRVAARLLALADRLRRPEDPSAAPDHARARELYLAAVQTGLGPERALRARLLAARCDIDAGAAGRAAQELVAIAYPEKAPRDTRERHPVEVPEALRRRALLLLGCARLAAGQPVTARRALEDLLDRAPADELAPLAAYRLGRTFGLPARVNEEALARGVAAWARLRARWPEHALAAAAALDTARALMAADRFAEAAAELERFLERPARPDGDRGDDARAEPPLPFGPEGRPGDERAQARRLLGDALRRLRRHEDAIAVLEAFLREHPTHPDWNAVRRTITDLQWLTGHAAHLEERHADARAAWERFAERHPLDARVPQALLLTGEGLLEEGRAEDAISIWQRLASKYPATAEAIAAVLRSAEVLEEKLDAPERARTLLRRAADADTAAAGPARERLAALERRELEVVCEKVARAGARPTLSVTARNMEKLKLRAWRLDLEAYFRKVHDATGIDALDVDLVAPDHRREVALEGGKAGRRITAEIALDEADEPGAWVVVLGDDHTEAVALALVSDIELIARAGPAGEAFVYVHDAAADAPAAGARVLLSDGARVALEGATGNDGVFRGTLPREMEPRATLRVLALRDGHAASATLPAFTRETPQQSVPHAFLYTARPVYRPGEAVEIGGIVREPARESPETDAGRAGALPAPRGLTFDQQTGWTLALLAPDGAVIAERTEKLDAVGAFTARLGLPEGAPTGRYVIRFSREDGPAFSTSFTVAAPRAGRSRAVIALERGAWFRGERVTGTVRVLAAHGEPLRGRAVTVRLGDGEPLEATTDARGAVAVSFETREQNETAVVPLAVTVPEEGITAAANVYIATRGLQLDIATRRPVFLQGEPVELTLQARDLADAGVAAAFEVTVERVERIGREQVVRHVATRTVKTGADGEGKLSLTLEKAGPHRVRAVGEDRLGNRVTASTELLVTGRDDEVKLRLLSERQTVHPGERIAVPVVSRAAAAGTALLTIETDRVVAYRTVRIEPGRSEVPIAVEPAFAPGFTLSIDLIAGEERHIARAFFAVERDLDIAVRIPDGPHAPGATIELEVTARDRTGAPAAAGFTVAVADVTLFEGKREEDPAAVFAGVARPSGLVAAASAPWRYEGTTREVPSEFLAEAERASAPRRLSSDIRPDLAALRDGTELGRPSHSDSFGIGGGQAGAYGQRWGKGSLSRHGGSRGELPPAQSYRGRNEGFFEQSGLEARRASPPAPPRSGAFVTGATDPSTGRARVKLALPEVPGVYRVFVVGATAQTLVGAAREEITVRGPLAVTLIAPERLVAGDAARVPVRVHELDGQARAATLRLSATLDGEALPTGAPRAIELPAGGEHEALFELAPGHAGTLALRAEVTVPGLAPIVEATRLEVVPWGREVVAAAARTLREDATLRLALPEGETFDDRRVEVTIARSVDQDVLHRLRSHLAAARVAGIDPQRAAATILESLAVARLRARTGQEPERAARHAARVAELVTVLGLAQGDDGGFGWRTTRATRLYRDQRAPAADVPTTVLAARALAAAQAAGHERAGAALERALGFLQRSFAASGDDEQKAMILFGLATSGDAGYARLNRLYRGRHALGATARAFLALALAGSGRGTEAADTARLLLPGAADVEAAPRDGLLAALGRREARGVAVLAVVTALRGQAPAREAAEALAAREDRCSVFGPYEVLALCEGLEPTAIDTDRLTVGVRVDGRELPGLTRGQPWARADAPLDAAVGGEVRVDLDLEGAGEVLVRARLVGTSRGLPAALAPGAAGPHAVARVHHAPPLRHRWREVPRGFGIVRGPIETWINRLEELPLGRTTEVAIALHDEAERPPYLVIEEPLPAGCRLVGASARGNFEALEVEPGLLRFFFGPDAGRPGATFEVLGAVPGAYRALPPRAYPAGEPERAVFGAAAEVSVLRRGEQSKDAYRPTPEELYHRGRLAFEADDLDRAEADLTALMEGFELQDEPLRESARMLLYAALAKKDAAKVVRWFEVLKERYEDLVVGFEDTRRVGEAYRALGEHERGLQVYRGVAEALFTRESPVAGALEAGGDLPGSVAFLTELADEYPDLQTVQSTLYQLAHNVYASADRADAAPAATASGGARGPRRREELIGRAAELFSRFLARYPDSPIADEAAFSLLAARLDLADDGAAGALARRLAARFASSAWLDEYLYVDGLAAYETGAHEHALASLGRVAEERFRAHGGTAGARAPSDRRDAARFLRAQVLHALGRLEEAREAYGTVRERFADARAAIEHIERRELRLPELLAWQSPGDAAWERPALKIASRNVQEAKLLVYQVDLMKLYLSEKSLEDIAGIHLAGISPLLERDVHLAAKGASALPRETEVVLPIDDAGAYLVVARAGDTFASGLVLVSGVQLEVAEDAPSGRVRVSVVKRGDGRPVARAAVRVVGSADGRVRAGSTDPRGVYTADAVSGRATVIARVGEEFAFYRGSLALGPRDQRRESLAYERAQREVQQQKQMAQQEMDDLLRAEILGANEANNYSNRGLLRQQYENKTEGVKVMQTK